MNQQKSKYRICIFIPSLGGGGAERMMVILANEFSERGYCVDLILAKSGNTYMQLLSEKVNIINLNSSRTITSILPLAKYLYTNKPRAILSALTDANIVTILAHKISFSSARLVISERSVLSYKLKTLNKTLSFVIKALTQITYPLSHKIIAISNKVAEDLYETIYLKRSRISTIYNPVIHPQMLQSLKEEIPHIWLKEKTTPIIVSVGRLSYSKDFENLINSFSLLLKRKKAKLIILGEGELRKPLEKIVSDLSLENYIIMPGFVDNPYIYMKHADIFVQSPRYEGFGNVLVEAMACGKQVISTDCIGGPAEILENGKWGKLVPVGDAQAMANAMFDSLENLSFFDVTERANFFKSKQIADLYLKELINN